MSTVNIQHNDLLRGELKYKLSNNLPMENKNWQHCVLCKSDLVPACPVCAIYAIAAVPPAMLAATFVNMQHHISLPLQAERNQFQHPL